MPDAPELIKPRGCGTTLVEWVLIIPTCLLLVFFLVTAILRARDDARRSQSKNGLKQIGLALQNYHDTYNTLPPGGVFDSNGIPQHCWTTMIDPYLWSSPWYSEVDFSVPWNDPKQIDHFLSRRDPVWQNPRVTIAPRADGFPVPMYAANSWLMHRNSSMTLKQINDTANTLLAAEVRGSYLPLGCPGNWRDVAAGLNRSDDAFGCRDGEITYAMMADGRVRSIAPDTSAAVWNALTGTPALRPAAARLQRPTFP